MTDPIDLTTSLDPFKPTTKAGPTLVGTLKFKADPELLKRVLGSALEQREPDLAKGLDQLRKSVNSAQRGHADIRPGHVHEATRSEGAAPEAQVQGNAPGDN